MSAKQELDNAAWDTISDAQIEFENGKSMKEILEQYNIGQNYLSVLQAVFEGEEYVYADIKGVIDSLIENES